MGATIQLHNEHWDAQTYLKKHPGPLNIDLLEVTIDDAFIGAPGNHWAVRFGGAHVSGIVRELVVSNSQGDGVKVDAGATDLTIGEDSSVITIPERGPLAGDTHLNCVQVQGGANVKFFYERFEAAPHGFTNVVFVNCLSSLNHDIVFDGQGAGVMIPNSDGAWPPFDQWNSVRCGIQDGEVVMRATPKQIGVVQHATAIDPVLANVKQIPFDQWHG